MRRYAGRRNGESLSSIKHVVGHQRETADNQSVRRHLDAFTRGRIIGKLEEGLSVTSVTAEFGMAHSIVSRLWRQFQTTGTAIRGFSSGRPQGTTPADDRYIVFQARRNRRQTAGEIARHTTQVTGRPMSRFTVARRLQGGGLFARRSVRCVPLTPAHRRRRSLWCREHRNWRDNEWGRVLFTDESRFSLSSGSDRILIWRERGSRNHLSNILERDRYGGRGVLVWGGIMLGSRTDLHIFAGSVNGTRYCNEILLPYVSLFRGAMGLQFLFMDDNAPCHRTVATEHLLESEDIERMDWPARSPDLNPIEHVWDFLGRRLAARTLPPVTIRELLLALRRHGRGRFRSTTPAEGRYIVLSAKRNRHTTAQQVANQFLAASGKQISRNTVARRLRGGGLYARIPVVCVPLTRQHRTARLQWCCQYHNWTEQYWACILFSDESRFSLSSDCRRQLIWRESGTAYCPENIQETDRYPTCSINVWAGIMINGRTRLHVVANRTMRGQRYIDEVLLPHVRLFRGAVGDKFGFMDDNATCHRTLAV
ncbi:transposable element Tcb1 transposase [Trichonephila clavipes]|nr:transposable element Tcb1 transposase [Trichonephila clavipes]